MKEELTSARGEESAVEDAKKKAKARRRAAVQAGQYLQHKDVTPRNLRVLDWISTTAVLIRRDNGNVDDLAEWLHYIDATYQVDLDERIKDVRSVQELKAKLINEAGITKMVLLSARRTQGEDVLSFLVWRIAGAVRCWALR